MSAQMTSFLPSRTPSVSSSEDDDDDQTYDDWVSASGDPRARSLFEERELANIAEALKYDRDTYGFDLGAFSKQLALDVHQRIRLVNYIRSQKPSPTTVLALTGQEPLFGDDNYLLPVLVDDPFLQLQTDDWTDDDDDTDAGAGADDEPSHAAQRGAKSTTHVDLSHAHREIRLLKERLGYAQNELRDYQRLVRTQLEVSTLDALKDDTPLDPPKRDDDTHYFESYGGSDVHWTMLNDDVRTMTYAAFILSNPSIFRDAVVLDVGCGTGILSLFAARAGAKKVFAVDASKIADKAEEIVKVNGYADVITIMRGKIESIQLPLEYPKVDVIISEWMGYALLYESMLDSVLYARDRFLKPNGGVMAPSQTRMMLALCDPESVIKQRVGFWKNVYGFDMTCMLEGVYDEGIAEVVPAEAVLTSSAVVKDLNLQVITSKSLSFSSPFSLSALDFPTSSAAKKAAGPYFSTKIDQSRVYARAFVLWFDTFFNPRGEMVPAETPVKVHSDEVDVGDVIKLRRRRTVGEKRRGGLRGSSVLAEKKRAEEGEGEGEGQPPPPPPGEVVESVLSEEPIEEREESFSTGPFSKETHWKQVVFLLKEPIELYRGVTVTGTFHCRKNEGNSRELDVEFQYRINSPGNPGNEGDSSSLIVQSFKVC